MLKNVGLALTLVLIVLVLQSKSQCAVRRSLPHNERPDYIWNATLSKTFKLPPVLKGVFREWLNNSDGSGAWRSRELTVEWQCLLKNELSPQKYWFVSEADTSVLTDAIAQKSKKSVRCSVQPKLSAGYLRTFEFWRKEKLLVGAESFDGTQFPWFPCADPNAYTDNEVLIHLPVLKLMNISTAAAAAAAEKVWRPADVKTAKLLTWAAKDYVWSTDQMSQYIHRSCEEMLALSSAGAMENKAALKSVVESSLLDPLEKFNATEIFWEPTSLTKDLDHEDLCLSDWSARALVARDSNTQKELKFLFNASPDAPIVDNPMANPSQLPSEVQCMHGPFWDVLQRVDTQEYRERVKARHACLRTPFPTNYAVHFKKIPATRNRPLSLFDSPKDVEKCVHSGMWVHTWTARACGQTAVSTVIQRVSDTFAPTLDLRSPRLTKKQNLVIFQNCFWPTDTQTMFCPADQIEQSLRPLVSDNCCIRSELKIQPEWSTATWSFCNRETCQTQPQLDGPAASDKCFLQTHISGVAPVASVLRFSVYVKISDPCANAVAEKILWTTTFVDPTQPNSNLFTEKYCTR